jgi:hypothetical protein
MQHDGLQFGKTSLMTASSIALCPGSAAVRTAGASIAPSRPAPASATSPGRGAAAGSRFAPRRSGATLAGLGDAGRPPCVGASATRPAANARWHQAPQQGEKHGLRASFDSRSAFAGFRMGILHQTQSLHRGFSAQYWLLMTRALRHTALASGEWTLADPSA